MESEENHKDEEPAGGSKHRSILVIDDDVRTRGLLLSTLARKGYRAVPAADGMEAVMLAMVRRSPFDLAICDITMPRLNGIGTLKALKSLRRDPEVIMMTGEAKVETALEAMQLGAFDYIAKPFKLAELDAVLERAVARLEQRTRDEELAELAQLKAELSAHTSHELRTPMDAIVGYVSMILQKAYEGGPAPSPETLRRIFHDSKELFVLIDGVLKKGSVAAPELITALRGKLEAMGPSEDTVRPQ